MSKTKTCSKCKVEFPATSQYFHKDASHKDGLKSVCIICMRNYSKEHYINNKEHYKQIRKKYNDNHRKEINQRYIKNKEQIERRVKQYYIKNKERFAEYNKLRRMLPEEKIKKNVYEQRRYNKKRGLISTLTVIDWTYIKEYFNNECAYCGSKTKLTQDHFIALSKNGEYSHNNIIPCCLSCNSSKCKNSFFKWYPKQSFYNKKRERKILKFLNYDGKTQQLKLFI